MEQLFGSLDMVLDLIIKTGSGLYFQELILVVEI